MADPGFPTRNEQLFRAPLPEIRRRNSELNHREYLGQETALLSFPRRLVFELTNRCNFRCIMCGREAVDFPACDLPFSLLQQFAPCFETAEEVTLHGWGEGTLHPQFADILAYLDTFAGLRKYFVTNGSTLEQLAEPIFRHHVDLVALSLDGASAATNDAIRRNGSFAGQVGALRSLLQKKRERGLDHPYINLVFTAMRRNLHELPELIELAYQLGLPEVKVVYLTIFSPELLDETLLDRQEEIGEVFAEASRRAEHRAIKLKLPEIQGRGEAGIRRHRPCPLAWRDLFVGSDGCLRPCQSSSLQLGRVGTWSDFRELWNSPALQDFRRRVNDEERLPASCRDCYHSSCANYNLPGSFIQLRQAFAPAWSPPGRAEGALPPAVDAAYSGVL